MPELEFIGDWQPAEAQAIALQLQKSLGVGDGGGAEVSVQQLEDNPTQQMLSKRQKRLIDLLRQAGAATFAGDRMAKAADLDYLPDDEHVCGPDCGHSWDEYRIDGLGDRTLEKALGQLKRDGQGRTYRMNANKRWERFAPGGGGGGGLPEFKFTEDDGPFGRGVYFPVLESPQGYMRLRLRASITGAELISDEELHALETDFSQNINRVLDSKGVRGIAQTEGDRVTLLCLRSPGDLQVLGAVADSGQLPPGPDYAYKLTKVQPAEDHLVIDVEVTPAGDTSSPQGGEGLAKAARVFARSPLSGTMLTPVSSAPFDRGLLRAAVERCKLDGVPVGEVSLEVVDGIPDFLPTTTCAFCLPGAQTIYLVQHDLQAALERRLKMMTRELRSAAVGGGIPYDVVVDTILRCQEIDTKWWLEGLIKRYTGAILAARVADVMMADDITPWQPYLTLLAGRGIGYWGDRRAIAECMAEDYRCAFDPSGFPNAVTMLWDLAVPQVARLGQQKLVSAIALIQGTED